MSKKRKRHNAEEVVKKLRDADAILAAGRDLAAVLQALTVTCHGQALPHKLNFRAECR